MGKVTWVAKPVTKEERIKDLILGLVNEIEAYYGEVYPTLGSARIESVVKEILELATLPPGVNKEE